MWVWLVDSWTRGCLQIQYVTGFEDKHRYESVGGEVFNTCMKNLSIGGHLIQRATHCSYTTDTAHQVGQYEGILSPSLQQWRTGACNEADATVSVEEDQVSGWSWYCSSWRCWVQRTLCYTGRCWLLVFCQECRQNTCWSWYYNNQQTLNNSIMIIIIT